MKRSRVPSLLHDLLTHAVRIRDVYATCPSPGGSAADQTARDAVLWNFVVLGEICVRLGEPFQEQHPQIPWRSVIAHRHLIAHGYDIIDWPKIAAVIEAELPGLIREAQKLLDEHGPPPAR